jgi:glycosyltransferase involved in cell wall biosynthesis
MHVAMVIQSFQPVLGGAQLQVRRLAPMLAQRGVRVSVITRRPPGAPARERLDGFDLLRLPAPGPGAGASIVWSTLGIRALRALRPDVIHAHELLSPGTVALGGRKLLDVPVVAKVLASGPHGDVARLLRKPSGRRRLHAMARRFEAFVSIDDAVGAELAAHGVDGARVHRIANGVDATHFRPVGAAGERRALRQSLGLPVDGPLALFCGRLVPEKRPAALVEAMHGAPGSLVLVGDGDERERLDMLAGCEDLRGRILVRPTVDDPATLYRAADVYVSASEQEGLSNAVLEAMASGLPVVAAPAGGMRQLLGDGAGVLLTDGSPHTIGTALRELAQAPGRRLALGSGARARVEADYALAGTADRLCALYADLIAEHRARRW